MLRSELTRTLPPVPLDNDAAMAAQPKRIVVGFDGTEGAQRALEAAVELMGYGSTLTVVLIENVEDDSGERVLASARELLLARLVTASYLRRVGDPADELLGAAAELDADVIVVGRRDPSSPTAVGSGSVSADVVRRADCDVLVVG